MVDNLEISFQEKTDDLIAEFKQESKHMIGDDVALKNLGKNKVKELAQMANDNKDMIQKQIEARGDDHKTYQYYSQKIHDIYLECSARIIALYE